MKIFILFLVLFLGHCETPQQSNRDCCLERQRQQKEEQVRKQTYAESSQQTISNREQTTNSTLSKKEVIQPIQSRTLKTYPPEKKQQWEDYFYSLKRNCPYSSLPSEVIASCGPDYRTYNLTTPEKKDIYYYALLNSNDYVRRRKAYYYYRSTCNERLPMVEILAEKGKTNLPDWERQEIQDVIASCRGESKISSSTYFPGGFSFHPEYPNGNGDINLYYTNEDEDPATIKYSLEAENLIVIPLNEQAKWEYVVPPNATLDEDISLLVVGHGNSNLKLIRNVNGEEKEFNSNMNFFSIGKGFSPRFWFSNKPYPVYYFAYESELNLIAFANDEKQEIINQSKMEGSDYQDGIYIYKAEIPLNGYTGWVTAEIMKQK